MPGEVREIRVMVGDEERSFYYPVDDLSEVVVHEVFQGEYPIVGTKRPKVIVDVGANIGTASVWFAMHYPDAEIHAYEPCSDTFEILKKNTSGLKVVCHNLALSDYDGEAVLNLSRHSSVLHSLYDIPHGERGTERVRVANAADELMPLKADILKLDTEGAEIQIFRALGALGCRFGVVYVEYHSEEDRKEIDDRMWLTHHLVSGRILNQNQGTMCYAHGTWLSDNQDIGDADPQ